MRNKNLRRFFVEEIKAQDGLFSIVGPGATHISRVLRMKRGDQLILMDAKGARFLTSIESAGPREVRVRLLKPLPTPSPPPVQIILCQALLKSRQMDYMIQKTSELGVDRIIPFSSERTVVSMRRDRTENRMRHWREIAHSAAMQSDRGAPAHVEPLVSFKDLMGRWKREKALKMILWEEERTKDMKAVLRTSGPAKTVVGIVGPEGGFSKEEIQAARDADFISASLGRRILRAETAALTMVAIVQYEWGDLSLNQP